MSALLRLPIPCVQRPSGCQPVLSEVDQGSAHSLECCCVRKRVALPVHVLEPSAQEPVEDLESHLQRGVVGQVSSLLECLKQVVVGQVYWVW
mmetsp:Transcript_11652/g.32901  ORF Transcript_11652/g.32901 Transcript_11652/m.32901 type:complete len:92 (+) Transcript_11652:1421-1696(+)